MYRLGAIALGLALLAGCNIAPDEEVGSTSSGLEDEASDATGAGAPAQAADGVMPAKHVCECACYRRDKPSEWLLCTSQTPESGGYELPIPPPPAPGEAPKSCDDVYKGKTCRGRSVYDHTIEVGTLKECHEIVY